MDCFQLLPRIISGGRSPKPFGVVSAARQVGVGRVRYNAERRGFDCVPVRVPFLIFAAVIAWLFTFAVVTAFLFSCLEPMLFFCT
jgi:hypothetical protein